MATASIVLPPPPLHNHNPDMPPRPPIDAGPRATLGPALLARTAAIQEPSLRCNVPAEAVGFQGSKKRGPPLPPSLTVIKKPKKTEQHAPPANCSGGAVVAVITALRRRALDKRVAGCLLYRTWSGAAAARQDGRTALRCVCLELPRGSLCALHQDAPGRSWMEEQQGGPPPVGGDREVMVPKVASGDGAEAFAEYARWRRSVGMPSRFYIEHVRAINARQKD